MLYKTHYTPLLLPLKLLDNIDRYKWDSVSKGAFLGDIPLYWDTFIVVCAATSKGIAFRTLFEICFIYSTSEEGVVHVKVGYVRVSTAEQNTARQEVLMEELGVDRVYIEKVSGKNTDRPQLLEMMRYVREGDTLIVESISRFARNTKDLLDLVAQLKEKKVAFVSKKEAIDTSTSTGEFMLTVFGAVSQLERENILIRQAEGIAIAKAEGRFNGRPCKKLDDFEVVYDNWVNKNITAVGACKQLGIARSTWYRRCDIHRRTIEESKVFNF